MHRVIRVCICVRDEIYVGSICIPWNHEGLRIKLLSTMSGYHASDARARAGSPFSGIRVTTTSRVIIIGVYYRDIHACYNALARLSALRYKARNEWRADGLSHV